MLDEDLKGANDMALEFISYAITCYPTLPGIVDKVKVLARVRNCGPDDERIYQNTLTEFMALRFVAQVLNERIVGLESSSPNGNGAKKCDLESERAGARHFYEVKDLSSEVLSQKPAPNHPAFTLFDPALPPKLTKWIEHRIGDCMAKGANYLVCRAPAWHVRNWPKLTADWVTALYPKFTQTGRTTFRVVNGVVKQPFFKGVYLLRRDEHLLMEF
jgi:hypothetical protein